MMATKRRVPVVFTDDPFKTPFTFDEVSKATKAQFPGETLLSASSRVRREQRGQPPAEIALAQKQRTRCPVCESGVTTGNIRSVALSNGNTVKLYVHQNQLGDGVGRVCRETLPGVRHD